VFGLIAHSLGAILILPMRMDLSDVSISRTARVLRRFKKFSSCQLTGGRRISLKFTFPKELLEL
jgi:hypothetical protein